MPRSHVSRSSWEFVRSFRAAYCIDAGEQRSRDILSIGVLWSTKTSNERCINPLPKAERAKSIQKQAIGTRGAHQHDQVSANESLNQPLEQPFTIWIQRVNGPHGQRHPTRDDRTRHQNHPNTSTTSKRHQNTTRQTSNDADNLPNPISDLLRRTFRWADQNQRKTTQRHQRHRTSLRRIIRTQWPNSIKEHRSLPPLLQYKSSICSA